MIIWVAGATGMLGSAVMEESRRRGYNTWPVVLYDRLESELSNNSFLINCAGAIPNGTRKGSGMVYANSVLPFYLAEACQKSGAKLIHVSTDCVFSGFARKPYNVDSNTDAKDLYGSSKALGENITSLGAIVVRTSFIGLRHGLLRWLIDNPNSKVPGYDRVLWTGSTVWEVASGLLDMTEAKLLNPIEHLSTEKVWTKYEVLVRISNLLELNKYIEPVGSPVINRALVPTREIRDLNDKFVATRLVTEWQK